MGAENRDRAVRNLFQLLDEAGALGLQAVDDMAVMDDFVPHIDRRPEFLQGALDNLDGADDARTEAARLSQDHLHLRVAKLSFHKGDSTQQELKHKAAFLDLTRRSRLLLINQADRHLLNIMGPIYENDPCQRVENRRPSDIQAWRVAPTWVRS
jgi:hypothetical protein